MTFFKTGYDHFETIEKEVEERQAASATATGRIFRFWMNADEEKNLIFLTDGDQVPVLEEHNLKLNGKFGNTFTCLKTLGQDCPLCEGGDRPSTVGFYLVIDRSVFKSKKTGKEYKDTIKVLPVKFTALKLLKKLSKKYDGLVYKEFEVSRSNPKAPNTGDQFIKEANHSADDIKAILGGKSLEEALEKSVLEFWEEYLQPKSAADLAVLVSNKQSGNFDAAEEVDFK